VILAWTGYDEQMHGDIDHYQVYGEENLFTQVADLQPIATLPAGTFTYTVDNLARDTLYYFAVVAVDTKGNVNTSVTPVSAVTVDITAPEDVTNLRVECLDDGLNFIWDLSVNTSGDLAGYKVYFNNDTEGISISATQTNFEQYNLDPATAYPFRITAYDIDNNESGGVTLTGVTLLSNPANLTATPYSGYVDLAWDSVEPSQLVKNYSIYVSETDFTSVAGMTPVLTVTGTSARVEGLTNDVTYYFGVTTVNLSDGEGKEVTTISSTPRLDNAGPELANIQVNGTALADGHLLLKPGTFTLDATDYSGINRIEFFVDGELLYTDSSGSTSSSYTLEITGVEDGDRSFVITAYDTLDNSATVQYTIVVNHPPPFDCFDDCINGSS
jgi:hypothetical protein